MKSTGLIGHWPLNEFSSNSTTTFDKSINKNHGTITSATLATDGRSMVFNGSTSKIDTGSDMIGIQACSISFWAYLVSGGPATQFFLNSGKLLLYASTRLRFSSDQVAHSAWSPVNALSYNTWTHICITRTVTGLANIYVNGTISGTADQNSGTPIAGSTNIIIGPSYLGSIADIKIYSYAMNAGQVITEYELMKKYYV